MQPSDVPLVFSVLALLGVFAALFGISIEREANDKRFKALDNVLMDHLQNDHGIDVGERCNEVIEGDREAIRDDG